MTDKFTRHKPIRNKIKTYDPLSILRIGIQIIHDRIDPAKNPMDWMVEGKTYFPWCILLLIRWTFQYSESNPNPKIITIREFDALCHAIQNLYDDVILEWQEGERILDAFTRRTLFYQLPFQVKTHEIKSSLGRQLILFQDMGAAYKLDDNFKSKTHISLVDYYGLYFCCWAGVVGGDGTKLSISYFQNQFPIEVVQEFFSVLALDLNGAKSYIRKHTAFNEIRKKIDYQLNEHTPLERYPFFQLGDRFIPYSAKLLDNSLMYNAYDIFKEIFKECNSDFSNICFGEIFEDYVAKGVEYACDNYLREPQIKSLLPKKSKLVDFLIIEPNASILIDAKSTDLRPEPRILQTKESMLKNLRSTIISGVTQIIVTAYNLRKVGKISKNDTIFGIVVTFKDYLIGDGKRFWDDIISETVEKELGKLAIKNFIPLENIFYISIADFDYLMAGAKTKSLPISEILTNAVKRNSIYETESIMLKQHLFDLWGKYFRPEYVNDRFEKFFNTLEERF